MSKQNPIHFWFKPKSTLLNVLVCSAILVVYVHWFWLHDYIPSGETSLVGFVLASVFALVCSHGYFYYAFSDSEAIDAERFMMQMPQGACLFSALLISLATWVGAYMVCSYVVPRSITQSNGQSTSLPERFAYHQHGHKSTSPCGISYRPSANDAFFFAACGEYAQENHEHGKPLEGTMHGKQDALGFWVERIVLEDGTTFEP